MQESGKPRGSWGAKEEQEAARVGNGPVVMSVEIRIKTPFEAGPQKGFFVSMMKQNMLFGGDV